VTGYNRVETLWFKKWKLEDDLPCVDNLKKMTKGQILEKLKESAIEVLGTIELYTIEEAFDAQWDMM